MSMRAAIIENGKVVRVVKAEPDFAQQMGWVVSETASVGDDYNPETGQFTTPDPGPEPVPQSVTKRQAKEALIRQGTYQSALTVLDNITDPTEKAIANNYWTESQAFERDNPVLISLALGGLSMTETELDDLFRYASTL